MQVMFTTLGCPDWSLEEIAANGQAYGYEAVELRTHDDGNHFSPDASADEAKRVAAMFREHNLPVTSVMGYTTFGHLDAAKVAENEILMRKLIGIAEAMGAPYIRTFAGCLPEGTELSAMTETVAKALKPLADEAHDKGITIGLETHDDWCAGASVMAVVEQVDCQGLGIVYDISNSIHAKFEPWEETYAMVRDHVIYCHLTDAYAGLDGKDHYVMLGAGDLPVQEIISTFKKDGYDGIFSFEWVKKWYPDELEDPERAFPQFPHKLRALWNA